ncbi:MAG TPA: sugar transferase [Anaerolineales bacterium]|nr:sugar transferase [Anaerolineales bacterium]
MIRQLSNLKDSRSLRVNRSFQWDIVWTLNWMAKRLFDIVFSILGLFILSPFFFYIAHLIRRDSPGPAFYWGLRAGMGGKTFRMLKFRTMYETEKSYDGPRVTCKDDDRITLLGRWLRDTKINELPQLWNVLMGDMSLVGPRPEDPEIVKSWSPEVCQEVLSVRPGVTSPASILYHDEENLLSTSNVMGDYFRSILPDKMRLDRLYVRNHSFFGDLDVIFWTIAILLPRVVKTRIPEGYLFAGPFSRLVERHLAWFLMDTIVAFGAGATAMFLWRLQELLNWGIGPLIALCVLIAVLFSGLNALTGLNRIVWAEAITEDAAGLILSAGITTIVTVVLDYLQWVYQWLPYPALPVTMIFSIGLMASIGFIAARYRWRLLTGFASRWLSLRGDRGVVERVVIVGSGEGRNVANWLLKQGEGSRILSIVGIIDDEQPAMQGMRVKGNRVLGGINDLPRLIERYDIGVVLFAVPNAGAEVQERVYRLCELSKARMVHVADLLSTLQKQLTLPARARAY